MTEEIFKGLKELVHAPGKLIRLPLSWAQLKDMIFGELEATYQQDGMWDLSKEEEELYTRKIGEIESK